jgi:GTP pyrophosphokinase
LAKVLTEQQLEKGAEEPGALRKVVNRILPFNDSPVLVRGQDDLLAFLAKCCNPLPGEEIVGYITRGRGVSVHSAECPNVKNLLYHPEREIDVEWARRDEGQYQITLEIAASDKQGLLARMAESIAKLDSNIRHIEAQTGETGKATIEVEVEVKNRRHLERLLQALSALDGIDDVHRRMDAGRRAG